MLVFSIKSQSDVYSSYRPISHLRKCHSYARLRRTFSNILSLIWTGFRIFFYQNSFASIPVRLLAEGFLQITVKRIFIGRRLRNVEVARRPARRHENIIVSCFIMSGTSFVGYGVRWSGRVTKSCKEILSLSAPVAVESLGGARCTVMAATSGAERCA